MIREELQDLLYLLSESSVPLIRTFTQSEWLNMIQEAHWHRVLPILIHRIDIKNNPLNIPDAILTNLLEFQNKQTQLANIQLFELKIISEILKQEKVQFIVLKGLPLSDLIYQSINLRTSKDIDLLISEENLDISIALLEKAGYLFEKLDRESNISKNIFNNYYNQIQAIHQSRNICIELHWRCTTNSEMFSPSFEDLYSNSVEKSIHSLSLRIMPLPETIVYLSSHFARTQTLRLKWLCDFDTIIRNNKLEWNEIEELAKKHSCLFSLHSTLLLSKKLLKTSIPNEIKFHRDIRTKSYVKLSEIIINTKSKYPSLSMLRLVLSGDNVKTFYHDFKSILTPRLHDPHLRILNYKSYYFIYYKRLIKLPLKAFNFSFRQLNNRLLSLYENTFK